MTSGYRQHAVRFFSMHAAVEFLGHRPLACNCIRPLPATRHQSLPCARSAHGRGECDTHSDERCRRHACDRAAYPSDWRRSFRTVHWRSRCWSQQLFGVALAGLHTAFPDVARLHAEERQADRSATADTTSPCDALRELGVVALDSPPRQKRSIGPGAGLDCTLGKLVGDRWAMHLLPALTAHASSWRVLRSAASNWSTV